MIDHSEVFEAQSFEALNEEIRKREWHGWHVHVLTTDSAVFSHPVNYDHTGAMKRVVRDSSANQARRDALKQILESSFPAAKFTAGQSDEPLISMFRPDGVTNKEIMDVLNDRKLTWLDGGGPWHEDYGREASQRFYVHVKRDDAYCDGVVVAIFDRRETR
jgi:hypothetical protein